VARDVAPRPTLAPLELRVLRLLGRDGLSERQAAEKLNYSHVYIREVAAAAARQLGARNTRQAIYEAARRGLI
jgi:DNA-binding NarL/FixJ family response regulator